MARSKAISDSFLISERRKANYSVQEYYPPDPPSQMRLNWVKIGMTAIIVILIFTLDRRAFDLSDDIQKIDDEIEEEALKCLQNFSTLNCPLDNVHSGGSERCRELYTCARKTKSTAHIQAFLEKATYMAVFEVTKEAIGPILIIAILVALKLLQKFE